MKIEHAPSEKVRVHDMVLDEPHAHLHEYSDPIDTGFRVTAKDMEAIEKSEEMNQLHRLYPAMKANVRILKGEFRAQEIALPRYELFHLQDATNYDCVDMIRAFVLQPTLDKTRFSQYIRDFLYQDGISSDKNNPFALTQSLRLVDEKFWKNTMMPYLEKNDLALWLRQKHKRWVITPLGYNINVLLAMKIAFPQHVNDFLPATFQSVTLWMQNHRERENWFFFARDAATLQLLRTTRIWTEYDGLHVDYEKPYEEEKPLPLPVLRTF